MTTLEQQLRWSIQMEAQKQALKTLIALGKQVQRTLVPSRTCNPVVAAGMRKDLETWQLAIEAGEKALKPDEPEAKPSALMCAICTKEVVGTIYGICLQCYDAVNGVEQIEGCDLPCCAGSVVQMPRRTR